MALRRLAAEPYMGKMLNGDMKGKYAYRIWPYRIVYQVDTNKKMVFIDAVGHRQGVYG